MTLAQLKELAVEKGITLTQTTKANVITEILNNLYPATLAEMELGELELDPEFESDVYAYEAATTNAKDKLAIATVDPNAEVTVKLGSTEIDAGTDGKYEITWGEDGEKTLTVKVENGYEGEVYVTYTITVTKS